TGGPGPGLSLQLRQVPVRAEVRLAAVPSGPNSVLGPCAPLTVVPCRGACNTAAVLTLPELVPRPNNQCSTHELPPRNIRPELWLWTLHLPREWVTSARCSLERR